MISFRRIASACTALLLFGCSAPEQPRPAVAVVFDAYPSAVSVAFPILSELGIPATFFVDPRSIDVEGGIKAADLLELRQAGWTIGAYSVRNMVSYWREEGRNEAWHWLRSLSETMTAKGVPTRYLAAAQRAWEWELSDLARPYFQGVRVIGGNLAHRGDTRLDPMYIDSCGTESLSDQFGADYLRDEIAALEGGDCPYLIVLVHDIGSPSSHSIAPSEFTAAMTDLAEFRDSGDVALVNFSTVVNLVAANANKVPGLRYSPLGQ